jgi:hypothetical protein
MTGRGIQGDEAAAWKIVGLFIRKGWLFETRLGKVDRIPLPER